MKWRPNGWKNPNGLSIEQAGALKYFFEQYEAGASAGMEALLAEMPQLLTDFVAECIENGGKAKRNIDQFIREKMEGK